MTADAMLEAITVAMVALHQRHHDRAPGSAKTLLMGGDLVACVMEDVYTDAEKTMIAAGRATFVIETRAAFQTATRREFINLVERQTEREVVAFFTNHHVGPDIEIKLFVLVP